VQIIDVIPIEEIRRKSPSEVEPKEILRSVPPSLTGEGNAVWINYVMAKRGNGHNNTSNT
jgi:hypothetical protein